jgi:hypothetical protein
LSIRKLLGLDPRHGIGAIELTGHPAKQITIKKKNNNNIIIIIIKTDQKQKSPSDSPVPR